MVEALRIGIAGLGTVGASVVRCMAEKEAELTRQCGRTITVTAVSARDRTRDRGIDLGGAQWFNDPVELARLTSPERGAHYRRLGLDPLQIEAAEAATRIVIAREARRRGRR